MSQIRKAHTVEVIDRRLRDLQLSSVPDPMELVGVYDELARVERKWLANKAQLDAATSHRRRPLSNATQLNARFSLLKLLVEIARRQTPADPAERALLDQVSERLRNRTPIEA